MSSPRRVAVIGLGNVLLGDDAIGPLVLAHFTCRYDLPDHVTAQDLGTPGLNLQPYLDDLAGLILVDAIRTRHPPGTVTTYDREALLRRPPPPRVSPHDLGLQESLRLVELAEGRALPTTLVGVTVEHTEQGAPMTGRVISAVDLAIDAIVTALGELGVTLEPKAAPSPPDIWWQPGEGADAARPRRDREARNSPRR